MAPLRTFEQTMTTASRLLDSARPAHALAVLVEFDNALTDQPDAREYGWIVAYRFRAAFRSGDFEQALALVDDGPLRFTADIPASEAATMSSMGGEAAIRLNKPRNAARLFSRSIELRRQMCNAELALTAAQTASRLLVDEGHHELAVEFVEQLIAADHEYDEHRATGYAIARFVAEATGHAGLTAQLLAARPWLTAFGGESAETALRFVPKQSGVQLISADRLPDPDQAAAGAAADALLAQRNYADADHAYRAVLDAAIATGRPDALVAGKAVLGMLLSAVMSGRLNAAHHLWTSESGSPRLGILALESGQVSAYDTVLYRLIEAFLHSLSTGDPATSSTAVDTIMHSCVTWTADHDATTVVRLLNNWKLHLIEIHGVNPPAAYTAALDAAERRWGTTSTTNTLYFPHPGPWRQR
ncbi:hypothetical protein [Nocardia sp. NPDC058666]|uniref:hypothetical protein n=1 Tax=Nocardia sp. NPDC058666 TaxID=3346587 RepID=UPI003654AF1A